MQQGKNEELLSLITYCNGKDKAGKNQQLSCSFPPKNSTPVEGQVDQHTRGCHLIIEEAQKKRLLTVLGALGLEKRQASRARSRKMVGSESNGKQYL